MIQVKRDIIERGNRKEALSNRPYMAKRSMTEAMHWIDVYPTLQYSMNGS